MIERPKSVRIAMKSDEQPIFDLLCRLWDENALFSMNPEKVKDCIRRATRNEGGVIGVIDGDDGLVASIGLGLSQYWYTDQWHVEEFWNFVAPEHRRSNNAKDLIDFAKWCSESMNLILNMGIITTHRTEAKIVLYKKRMTQVGAYFMHGIPNGKGPAAKDLKEKELA
jgi:hypothetical protein